MLGIVSKNLSKWQAENVNIYKKAYDLLAIADVEINGNRIWDIQVHNDRFYRRVFSVMQTLRRTLIGWCLAKCNNVLVYSSGQLSELQRTWWYLNSLWTYWKYQL